MKCSLHLSDSDKPPSLGHVVCSVTITIQPGPAAYFQKAGPNNCSLREPVLTRSGQHKIKPKLRETERCITRIQIGIKELITTEQS